MLLVNTLAILNYRLGGLIAFLKQIVLTLGHILVSLVTLLYDMVGEPFFDFKKFCS